ncbi:MAG: signal peptidase I [Dehalococcoidia bacterium]|jgi:signal peptidase
MRLTFTSSYFSRQLQSRGAARFLRLINASVLLTGYCLLSAVALLLLLPKLTGIEVRDVVSGSMEPTIHMHAVAITRPVEGRQVHVHDVILFREPRTARVGVHYGEGARRPVLHRVVNVVTTEDGGVGFETKGDANGTADGWTVRESDLVGKLVLDVPALGNAFNLMATRPGYFLFVVVPGLLIMIPELLVIYRWARWGSLGPSATTVEATA